MRLYLLEAGWVLIRELMRSANRAPSTVQLWFCDLALPETVSAVQQAAHSTDAARRGISRAALRHTLPRVRDDFGVESPLMTIPSSSCMSIAAEIVERQQVRGADAVHIAAALAARNSVGPGVTFIFVSNDKQQCKAAEREGLEVLTPA
ncbi:MAG TPA: hypothetical protein VEY93_11180 [Longimicrobium sp.]|nr:hypothetical protein [Longimicrobium sp.]